MCLLVYLLGLRSPFHFVGFEKFVIEVFVLLKNETKLIYENQSD